MICRRNGLMMAKGLLVVALVLTLANPATAGRVLRLSLNVYGFVLDGGAFLAIGGGFAPLFLPRSDDVPSFAANFTIPNDYDSGDPLFVEILWETNETDCNFFLRPNFLNRNRLGQGPDLGGASTGLDALEASTTFTLTGIGIVMAAPDVAEETAMVVFTITGNDGEFPKLDQGDAINFGIFRATTSEEDTCANDLRISGVSVVYEKGKIPKTND